MRKRKPYQPLLGLVSTDRPATTFEDRGHGTEQTPWQRNARLARERAVHEQTKRFSDAVEVLREVKLRRMK